MLSRLLPRLLLSVIALAALPAPAVAAMEIGMQDDPTIVNGNWNRDLALKQFKAMGGTNVRMNFVHRSGKRSARSAKPLATVPRHLYDSAVRDIRKHGLTPQMTLVWNQPPSPERVARWMGAVARHFGDKIPRYSVMNEADLRMGLTSRCSKRRQWNRFARQHRRQMVRVRGEWRAKVRTRDKTLHVSIACLRYKRGVAYRELANAAAAQIRNANPDAQILGGETSAQLGLEWFIKGARPGLLDIDAWAHHPFQLHDLTPRRPANGWGVGNLKLLQKLIKMPLYLTEFGYPHPNSTMDKRAFGFRLRPKQIARVLPQAWQLARDSGAKEMTQYQWYVKPPWHKEYWETALLNKDNGRLTPAYRALRKLIKSWG